MGHPRDAATVGGFAGKAVSTSGIGASTDYIQDHYIKEQAGLSPDKDYKKVESGCGTGR